MIQLKDICKTYRVARREAGFKAAARALFHKEYSLVKALDKVSFTINEGEMVGYIGPNGAGKSSTIKVMSGILTPDEGSCTINGLNPWKQRKEHVKNIGVVFGQRSQLWWDVPVGDSYQLIRDIYSVDKNSYRKVLAELTELLKLSEILRTPARQLSLGQRMRCEIGAALLHQPKILFLDEPTIGLDAVSKIAVREFIRSVNKEKKTTVILTTHDMQDIEALTERILLIGKGKILLDGPLQELKKRDSSIRSITIQYEKGSFLEEEGIILKSDIGGRAEFVVDTERISVSKAIALLTQRAQVTDISVASTSAEEMVVGLYKEFSI